MASGAVFKPSPWGVLLYEGRAAGFEPKLVELAALPRYQWAIPALKVKYWFKIDYFISLFYNAMQKL
jgi:hypothetical protein